MRLRQTRFGVWLKMSFSHARGANSAPLNPLAGFEGATSRWRKRKGGQEGNGRNER